METDRLWLGFLGLVGGFSWANAFRTELDWWWLTAAAMLTAGVLGELLLTHVWKPRD